MIEDLGNKRCAYFVSQMMEQKEQKMVICHDIIDNVDRDHSFLRKSITADGLWCCRVQEWMSIGGKQPQKVCASQLRTKTTLLIVFDNDSIILERILCV